VGRSGSGNELEHQVLIESFTLGFEFRLDLALHRALLNYLLRTLVHELVERLQIVLVLFGIGLLRRVVPHGLCPKGLLGDLQHFVKILEEVLGFGTVCLLDILSVDLDDGRKPIDDEFLQEGGVRDGVPLRLDDDDFEVD
jgi:hypothetical protein